MILSLPTCSGNAFTPVHRVKIWNKCFVMVLFWTTDPWRFTVFIVSFTIHDKMELREHLLVIVLLIFVHLQNLDCTLSKNDPKKPKSKPAVIIKVRVRYLSLSNKFFMGFIHNHSWEQLSICSTGGSPRRNCVWTRTVKGTNIGQRDTFRLQSIQYQDKYKKSR
jgi:hypothetical protein